MNKFTYQKINLPIPILPLKNNNNKTIILVNLIVENKFIEQKKMTSNLTK